MDRAMSALDSEEASVTLASLWMTTYCKSFAFLNIVWLTAHCLQVCVEVVGYLLEELRDGKNYEAFKSDMQTANVFIGSLIFIEELADKVSGVMHVHSQVSQGLPR